MTDKNACARFGVILAGGAGERFWPLSRQSRPKQLLHLTDPGRSMLQEAVDRLTPLIPAERIYVVTSRALAETIADADVGIPRENVVAEPCKRNTTGALAYITAHLLANHPDWSPESISMAINTADHRIEDETGFRKMVETALDAAEEHDALVTCGIVPTRPETGFGYIQASDAVGDANAKPAVNRVRAFHEKPNAEMAEEFMSSGNYYWNSGTFYWKAGAFLRELDEVRPNIAQAVLAMARALQEGDNDTAESMFESLEDISIDYALMEHAKEVLMVRGEFGWDDVGSWSSLPAIHAADESGNSAVGDPVLLNTRDCIVYNAAGEQMAVGISDVEDVVVVVTEDAVLVVSREKAQNVRKIVAELKRQGRKQL